MLLQKILVYSGDVLPMYLISIGCPKMPSATSFKFVIVKNKRAIAKPYCIRAIRKSVAYIPFFPIAASATSANETLPMVAPFA
jgi:hypothetical protein